MRLGHVVRSDPAGGVASRWGMGVRRRQKAGGDKAAGPPAKARKARKRREGWNGSVYRRPSKEATVPAEAANGPFIEDPLDDIGRR